MARREGGVEEKEREKNDRRLTREIAIHRWRRSAYTRKVWRFMALVRKQ